MDLNLATLAEGLWPFIMGRLRPHIVWYAATNNSGGALAAGDVVVVDTSADLYVTTSTTQSDSTIAGVVVIGGADSTIVYVATHGTVTVNVTGAVSRGAGLEQSTTAKLAQSAVLGAAGVFGVAVSAAAGPGAGTVTAVVGIPAL